VPTWKIAALSLVCSNCPRVIHRKRRWITIDELKTILGATCKRKVAHFFACNQESPMRKIFILCSVSFILLTLYSCSTLPSTFSTENIMQLHVGMSSGEILGLFGEPKNIRVAVCGQPPNQWVCTTWEYGEFPYERASFTFSGEHNSLKLNNFDIDRD